MVIMLDLMCSMNACKTYSKIFSALAANTHILFCCMCILLAVNFVLNVSFCVLSIMNHMYFLKDSPTHFFSDLVWESQAEYHFIIDGKMVIDWLYGLGLGSGYLLHILKLSFSNLHFFDFLFRICISLIQFKFEVLFARAIRWNLAH